MSVDELRGAVDNHVGAEAEGSLKNRRGEGVVHDHLRSGCMGDLRRGCYIDERHRRVGWCLQVHGRGLGVQLQLRCERIRFQACYPRVAHPELGEHIRDQVIGRAVQDPLGDDVVACLGRSHQGRCNGRHSRGEDLCRDPFHTTTLEGCQLCSQSGSSGVAPAGVHVRIGLPRCPGLDCSHVGKRKR